MLRQENKRIRWFLTEAAHMAARYDPKMKTFYERISRKKGHQKALIAVARKMLVSIYFADVAFLGGCPGIFDPK